MEHRPMSPPTFDRKSVLSLLENQSKTSDRPWTRTKHTLTSVVICIMSNDTQPNEWHFGLFDIKPANLCK